jgi:Lipocalin-like domain
MQAGDLVGTWQLVRFIAETPGGMRLAPWGPNPSGQLMYSAEGRMSLVMTDPDRAKFASTDAFGGTPEEIRHAFEGMEAYAGRYEVDSLHSIVIHHVEVARLPHWSGLSQRRFADLRGNELQLRTPPMRARGLEVVLTLLWQRIPAAPDWALSQAPGRASDLENQGRKS